MRKLLKWVLPAILGIVPALGMDDSSADIKDPFFTKKDSIVSIRLAFERGPIVMAKVDATDPHRTATKDVIAECAPDGWELDDVTKTSKEKVIAQVFCGTDIHEMPYIKREKHPYVILSDLKEANFIGDLLVANADLLPGKKATLHDVSRFQRPDKTELTEKGDALQEIIAQIWYKENPMTPEDFLKEPEGTEAFVAKFALEHDVAGALIEQLYPVVRTVDTGVAFDYYWCWKHENEVQRGLKNMGQKKMRHAHRKYRATPTTSVIKKNTLHDKGNVFAGTTETLLTQLSQQEIGGSNKNEPDCTAPNNYTNGLPVGYRVI